jgi:hypothetical protein
MSDSMEDRAEEIRKLEEIVKSLHGGATPMENTWAPLK